jgi:hypothetical protein
VETGAVGKCQGEWSVEEETAVGGDEAEAFEGRGFSGESGESGGKGAVVAFDGFGRAAEGDVGVSDERGWGPRSGSEIEDEGEERAEGVGVLPVAGAERAAGGEGGGEGGAPAGPFVGEERVGCGLEGGDDDERGG